MAVFACVLSEVIYKKRADGSRVITLTLSRSSERRRRRQEAFADQRSLRLKLLYFLALDLHPIQFSWVVPPLRLSLSPGV